MEALEVDAVIADFDETLGNVLVIDKVSLHILAIDDDAVDEMVRPAEKLV